MISFQHGSRRNTKCYIVCIAGARFYVSYNTIIGASVWDGDVHRSVRVENSWGPTTGRHMTDMDIRGHEIITAEELQRLMRQHIIRTGQQLALNKLDNH